jgi:maleamate amidohydrolase
MNHELRKNYQSAFGGSLAPQGKVAIVVIDLVVAYLTTDSVLWAPSAQAALEVNLRLVAQARAHNCPVILTRVEYENSGRDGGQFFKKVPALAAFVKGSALGEFAEGLQHPSDVVVTKQYASAFFGTSLASTLRALEVETVLITGYSTSGCVRATTVDALQSGFIPFVVEPACADRHADPHAANIFDMQAKYSEVVDEEFALELLKGSAPSCGNPM